ncbi:class I SAM-dependent methyltransferase [Flavobacterium sp.]|uniref:class I SAM-dependent methyltransferase n=1 Tax=Flavobacterium sp. TaxID=239 RepID=UPI003753E77D
MSYSTFIPLIKKSGSSLSPEKFHERINIVFHNHEAVFYDEMHTDMKESLQQQIDLLVSDLFKTNEPKFKNLRLLDVGCGTGLSTQFLLNSKIGNHIEFITLLDSSENMLAKAKEKAEKWNKNYTIKNDYISNVNEQYDVVIICSVLHHIPNLNLFFQDLNRVLKTGGILIHLQDPNGDELLNIEYVDRLEIYQKQIKLQKKNKKIIDFIPKNIKNYISRLLGRKTYIDKINDQLILEGTIKNRISANDLWSVTDIHVETKTDKSKGISLVFLKDILINYSLINSRSYGFFGFLKSDLNVEYKEKEEKLIQKNQTNGRNLSCVWIKN